MQTSAIPLTEGKFLLDNSTLSDIIRCPRSAFYKHILQRQLIKPRMAMFFGGAIHKALEVRDRKRETMLTPSTEDEMLDALIAEYSGVDCESDYRNLEYAVTTIQKYNTAWKIDPHIALLHNGEPAVELPFALELSTLQFRSRKYLVTDSLNPDTAPYELSEIPVVFTGKIDRICEHNGAVHLLDHKTTSIGGTTFFDEFFTSLQFRGYKYAAQHLLGKPVAGVIINALMCRSPLKSGGVNYTFDRQVIPIDDSLVVEWKSTFTSILLSWFEMIHRFQQSEDIQHFPVYAPNCITKYGRCEYFDVCQLPVSHRPHMIFSGLFENHSWSPLEDSAKPKPKPEFELPEF